MRHVISEALKTGLSGLEEDTMAAVLSFGAAALDSALPWNGLPAGVHEFCPADAELSREAAATQLVAYLLGRTRGPVVWALSRRFLFAPGLSEVGLTPDRLFYAEGGSETDVLAVAEEALRYGGLVGVVAETHKLSLTASRRLQLAAKASGTPCLALRRWKRGAPPQAGTAAMTRWSVDTRPSRAKSKLPRPSWRLELQRCRGGQPGSWNVELVGDKHETASLHVDLAAELACPAVDAQDRQRTG
jgi:protein ImuA